MRVSPAVDLCKTGFRPPSRQRRPLKAKLLPVLIAAAAILAAGAQDIRYVNNIAVDLSPLRTWLQTRKGDRPLKHWKEIRVATISPEHPWPKGSVTIEGETKIVFLRDLPSATMAAFAEVAALRQQTEQLSNSVAAERIQVDKLKAGTHSRRFFRRAARNQQQQVKLGSTNLAASTKQLDSLRSKLKSAEEKERKLSLELGMNTGQKYAGLEIWDFGQKR